MPVQGTLLTRGAEYDLRTVPKASPAPRDNSFDCSLNRHELTILLSCTHAHNHKSTEDNLSIPLKNWGTTLF